MAEGDFNILKQQLSNDLREYITNLNRARMLGPVLAERLPEMTAEQVAEFYGFSGNKSGLQGKITASNNALNVAAINDLVRLVGG